MSWEKFKTLAKWIKELPEMFPDTIPDCFAAIITKYKDNHVHVNFSLASLDVNENIFRLGFTIRDMKDYQYFMKYLRTIIEQFERIENILEIKCQEYYEEEEPSKKKEPKIKKKTSTKKANVKTSNLMPTGYYGYTF